MMRKITLTFFAVLLTASLFAQTYVARVLVLNEGYFDYLSGEIITPVSVGAYDPVGNAYTLLHEIADARFASDIKIDGANYYVAADKFLNKYDINTDELLASIEIAGIRKIAVNDDYIVVTRGEYLVSLPAYVQIYDKNTMALVHEFDNGAIPYSTEGVVIKDNVAYVAVNNGFVFGEEVGEIAEIDLNTKTVINIIDLGPDGINPDNLMIDGDNIFTLNNKDFTGSSVSTYKIASGDLSTTNLINISAGCGTSAVFGGDIYYQEMFGTTLSTFNPATQTIIAENEFGASFYALAFDEVNTLIYTSTTDYFSYGNVTIYDLLGNVINTFDVSVSPGNFAFDVRLASGINNAIVNPVTVFPNPAINSLTVQNVVNGNSIIITDLSGKVMQIVDGLQNGNIQIDVNALPAGSYLIQVIGNTGASTVFFTKL